MAARQAGNHHRDGGRNTDLRLVLIGKTGTGKSKTGNTILDDDHFRSVAEASSVTGKCQLGRGSRWGRNIQVVDTPGLFDTGLTQDQVADEIRKCVAISAPGPHAIILVTAIGRFTKEESDTVDFFRQMFGEEVTKYLVVLFTRRDDLDDEGVTIEDYLTRIPDTLSSLLQLCGRRYVAFNNRAPPGDKATQVRQLLQVVDRLVEDNGGHCYTSEMFAKAEEIMRKREEELRRQHEMEKNESRESLEKFRAQEAQMRREFEKEMQEMRDKMAALESGQGGGSREERGLRQEVEELRQLVAAMKESQEMERERMHREMEEMQMRATQPTPDFRQVAQDEVTTESHGILSTLKKGLSKFIDVAWKKVGSKVVHGLEGLVEKGFNKVLNKAAGNGK